MNRVLKIGFVSMLAAGSVTAPLLIRHSGQAKLREKQEHLRQATDVLARLATENRGLESLLVQEGRPQPLSEEQLMELLRLEGTP